MRTSLFSVLLLPFLAFPILAQEPQSSATPAPTPKPPETAFPYVGQVNAERVNLRAGDGTNYGIVSVASKGDKVIVTGEKFGWLMIQLPPQVKPWVASEYVARTPDSPQGTISGDNVRVRSKPAIDADMLGQLPAGKKVRIVGYVEGWYQIDPPAEASAWVLGQYVDYYSTAEKGAVELIQRAQQVIQVRAGLDAKIAKAEELFRQEMAKPMPDRDFNPAITQYEEIIKETDDPAARDPLSKRLEAVRLIQSIVDSYKLMYTGNEQFMQKFHDMEHRLAQMEEAAKKAAAPTYVAEGWLEPMGRIINSPATHKLVVGGKPIYLLKSSKVDLNSLLYKRVGVNGAKQAAPGWEIPVIDVTEMALLGKTAEKPVPAATPSPKSESPKAE